MDNSQEPSAPPFDENAQQDPRWPLSSTGVTALFATAQSHCAGPEHERQRPERHERLERHRLANEHELRRLAVLRAAEHGLSEQAGLIDIERSVSRTSNPELRMRVMMPASSI